MGPTRWVTLGFAVLGILVAVVLSKALPVVLIVVSGLLAKVGVLVKIPDYALLGPNVTVTTAVAWVGSLGAAVYYYRQEKWHTLGTEIVQELRKVVFPTVGETRSATVVVVITTVIIAMILYLFDAIWSSVTSWIYT